MTSTYYQRRNLGLCPECGHARRDKTFILCEGCRKPALPPPNTVFLALHEWMIRQGKHFTPEYEI